MAFVLVSKRINLAEDRINSRKPINISFRERQTRKGKANFLIVFLDKHMLEKFSIKDKTKFLIYFDDVNNNLWRLQKTINQDKYAYKLVVRGRNALGVLTIDQKRFVGLNLKHKDLIVKSIDDIKFIDENTIEFELVAVD